MTMLGKTHLSENGEALPLGLINNPMDWLVGSAHDRQVRWYAVYTSPRHEKRVREHLGFRNVVCFLPTYEAVHRWKNGCKVKVELPMFANYLFVNIDIRERVKVLEVPGVLAIVGSGNKSLPLPDLEIETLRTSMHLHKCEPHNYLVEGQKVTVKSGPFANLMGVLVRKAGGVRVVVSLDVIKRSVAVEVDEADVEPINESC
ncbi:MAG TPA: UpxY family transcription antiterminator [Terriglobia bacterium]|nr:UpxY family transcription antiterminator [Terriglobia bacterium]